MVDDPKIYIAVPCHNRKRIVELCLPTLKSNCAPGDSIVLYNDGSTEYDCLWLNRFGHRVHDFTKPIGIEAQRRKHFFDFWKDESFTHLYLTDSDAIHSPAWRKKAIWLQQRYGGAPVCLYNTEAHVRLKGNTLEDNPESEVIWRAVAPGISYFLTREHVAKIVRALPHLPEHWHWDWQTPALLSNRMAISRDSYVDHIGVGGMHHPANKGVNGGDRALNPTPWLVSKRTEIVKALEKKP